GCFPRAAAHHPATHAVAAFGSVRQLASNLNHASMRRVPATYGRVLQIVAHMTALGIQDHPAQLFVRQILAALPSAAGEVRQRFELLYAGGRFVEFPITVLPGYRLPDGVRR